MQTCTKCGAPIGASELSASVTGATPLGPIHYPKCPDSTQALSYSPCPTCGKESRIAGRVKDEDTLVPYECGACGSRFSVTLGGN